MSRRYPLSSGARCLPWSRPAAVSPRPRRILTSAIRRFVSGAVGRERPELAVLDRPSGAGVQYLADLDAMADVIAQHGPIRSVRPSG